jgi:hypothetical protein
VRAYKLINVTKLRKNLMKTKTNFTSTAGRQLAEMLAKYIVAKEPLVNRDECIDEIRELVCHYSDLKANAPVSALIKAEDHHRLSRRMSADRYKVRIQEEPAVC